MILNEDGKCQSFVLKRKSNEKQFVMLIDTQRDREREKLKSEESLIKPLDIFSYILTNSYVVLGRLINIYCFIVRLPPNG